MSGYLDKVFLQEVVVCDEFLRAIRFRKSRVREEVEKGKGCRSYHSENEDMANEETENMLTTGQASRLKNTEA